MKNKLFLCFIALITFGLYSCEDTISVGVPATITINVRDYGQPLPNAKVYMFEDNHDPSSSFFKPFYADTTALTNHYGAAVFTPEVFDDIETFYFAVFDGNECLGYVQVSTSGGDTRSADLFIGGTPGYCELKEVLKETTLTAHSVNYNGDANNRTFVPIKLPKNTVSFVYSVSSNYADNTSPTLRLLADLVERYDPTHGLLADIVNSLDDPVGTADCSIYLIKDDVNFNIFKGKTSTFQYSPDGTRIGIKSGIVEVELDEPLPENYQWYLGIENPDSKNDIYVTIEVCALVFHE